MPAVKNDEPVETITGELRVKNAFERAFFLPVIPDKLGGDRATGQSMIPVLGRGLSGNSLPIKLLLLAWPTPQGPRAVCVSQIGMDDKAISIAAALLGVCARATST